jgi:hypothetical protein
LSLISVLTNGTHCHVDVLIRCRFVLHYQDYRHSPRLAQNATIPLRLAQSITNTLQGAPLSARQQSALDFYLDKDMIYPSISVGVIFPKRNPVKSLSCRALSLF